MDYYEEVTNAIDYIEEHLFDKNVYDAVISNVHISKFHFHRIFLMCTMNTIGNYIKKRRFTVIANRLRNTRDKVIEIALDCNYESHEAFSRAFKNYFLMSPNTYRKSNNTNSLLQILPINKKLISLVGESYEVTPTFEHIEYLKLNGYLFTTPIQNHKLQEYFNKFNTYVGINSLKIKNEFAFAVWLSDKRDARELIDNEEYPVFIGSTLDNGSYPELEEIIIENTLYVSFKIEGNFQYINELYKYIYFGWLKKNNYELENAPIIERYSKNFSVKFNSGCMWILVPIKKKQ